MDDDQLPGPSRYKKRSRELKAAVKEAEQRLRSAQQALLAAAANRSVDNTDSSEEGGYSDACEDFEMDSDVDFNPINVLPAADNSAAPTDHISAPSDSDSSLESSSSSSESSTSDSDNNDNVDQIVVLPVPGQMTDVEKERYLVENLQEWGCNGVSKTKLDDLLKRLNPVFPSVPRSYKTLLNTPRVITIDISPDDGAEMWYKGIEVNLKTLVTEEYLQKSNNVIMIDVNMDGLPLFKSSSKGVGKGFWPILGRLVPCYGGVFVIGAFCGCGEPRNLWFFLGDFVEEVSELRENGVEILGKNVPFIIDKYIFDAKARTFAKCCKGQRGYDCCEKCYVKGIDHDHRMILLDLDRALRTDADFIQKAADLMMPKNSDFNVTDDNEVDTHVVGVTPLLHCESQLVSKFRLDGMHLIDKGVTRRIFYFWKEETGPFKLSNRQIQAISQRLLDLIEWFPSDFNRPQNNFEYVLKYKATELRRILLYDGILVFKDIVDRNVYQNFLLYHCGIFILRSPKLFRVFNAEAKEFLRLFVEHSVQVYGLKFCVYNVHSLIHFPQECLDVDSPVDGFSAYPFENKLKDVKAAIRSGYQPLQQFVKRDAEMEKAPKKIVKIVKDGSVSIPRLNDPDEQVEGRQFQKLHTKGVTFNLSRNGDSCCMLDDGSLVVITNIIQSGRDVRVCGQKFRCLEDLDSYPVPSSLFKIFHASRLSPERTYFSYTEIQAKYMRLPVPNFPNKFLCLPLCHQI